MSFLIKVIKSLFLQKKFLLNVDRKEYFLCKIHRMPLKNTNKYISTKIKIALRFSPR